MEYSVDKSDLQTSLEKKIEELELAVAQYVTATSGTEDKHSLIASLTCFIILRVVLSTREKMEDNLVNAMETIDNDQGTGQSADNRPSLMFKIASKSKKQTKETLQTRQEGRFVSCCSALRVGNTPSDYYGNTGEEIGSATKSGKL